MTADAADTVQDEVKRMGDGPSPKRGPTPDDDERLRGLIRTELERQHAMPLARRTLELLAEAELEPTSEEPGYRVIDRNGETRLLRDSDAGAEDGGDVTAPMTLRGLVAELRERHPDLFATPPEPETVDTVPPPPPEPPHDTLADVKAAGARFVETQSALAKTLATNSAERGRTFATAASGRFESWRRQLGERFKARPEPAPAATATSEVAKPKSPDFIPTIPPAEPNTKGGLAQRGRAALTAIDWQAFDLHRLAFIGLAAATVLVIGVVVMMTLQRGDGRSTPTPQTAENRTEPKDEPKPATDAPKPSAEDPKPAADAAKPIPETRNDPASRPPEPAPEDAEAAPVDEPPRKPNDLAGVPQVIDTATLKVAGKVIHLFGVEWVRGGQADELTKYIRGRSITCRPAQGSSAFLCTIEGRDLSEVVLFNGGGRASSEASPDLVAAEDHARTERLGVWKR
ncbi:hypothetical protein HCU64_05340 [Methylobacterium sp. C25]|uniref:thermonuclease family protein n=1 Tax=Methylobacterium sp. C25 TaxID=2721622 RepID=UPI001F458BB9|nr:hypothetical protein [Methylobacterium sp. C25]MCE4223166.1 hypothetical protein [Methylobacterium sp. C25]